MPAARRSSRLRRALGVLTSACLGLTLVACNEHPVSQVLQAPIVIGISIPIPPPSLTAEPVQSVTIEGELGITDVVPDTLVYLYDHRSDRGYFVRADDVGQFFLEEIRLDLTSNCLQLWFAEPGLDGAESPYSFYMLSIDEDDQSIVIDERHTGCS